MKFLIGGLKKYSRLVMIKNCKLWDIRFVMMKIGRLRLVVLEVMVIVL